MGAVSLSRLGAEFTPGPLARALAMLVPGLALFVATGDPHVLRVGLVTISLARVAEGMAAPLSLLALQSLAVAVATAAFLAAMPHAWTLAATAALVACGAVWATRYGGATRLLGTWTLIPSLYLACELWNAEGGWSGLGRLLAWWPLSVASVGCVAWAARRVGRMQPASRLATLFARPSETPAAARQRHLAMFAMVLAVAGAALVMRAASVADGQWVIWSAATVVTGELASSSRKMRDRMRGAALGVPLGLLGTALVPGGAIAHGFIAIGIPLTIVGFRRYWIGFAARSCLIVLFAGGGLDWPTGLARIGNVVAGGLIGVAATAGVDFAARRLGRRTLVT